uniref:CD99 antigen-like protein 2 n=1 Tax=Castor canadensis TaxID=51338 RepID=A0A8C0ZYI1_CASCN
ISLGFLFWLVCLRVKLKTCFLFVGYGDFGDDFNLEDALKETSSVKLNDFDLADALDDRNDQDDGRRKPSAGGGGGFSDKDLEDIVGGGGYKPDKNKGDGGYGSSDDPGSGMSAETGTIAGVASALAMALIGAVSSYISTSRRSSASAFNVSCYLSRERVAAGRVVGGPRAHLPPPPPGTEAITYLSLA